MQSIKGLNNFIGVFRKGITIFDDLYLGLTLENLTERLYLCFSWRIPRCKTVTDVEITQNINRKIYRIPTRSFRKRQRDDLILISLFS